MVILEYNCQPSNTNRDRERETVYTDGGILKTETLGASSRRISYVFRLYNLDMPPLLLQLHLEHLKVKDCKGVPQINENDLVNEKFNGKLYFSSFLMCTPGYCS